ncbi:MAG: hypothetical protein IPK96_11645 [Flammeovirgaceae bacterium]|nr:hypothetical protein [Flammeovirgaceae bacterium]
MRSSSAAIVILIFIVTGCKNPVSHHQQLMLIPTVGGRQQPNSPAMLWKAGIPGHQVMRGLQQ